MGQSGIDNPTVLTFSLTLANAFIVSATIALTFMTMVRLGYEMPISAVVALLLAFGTMFWSYASKSMFAEPLLALCTTAAFYSGRCHRQSGSHWALLTAGAWAGWGILTKTTAFALVPWLALYAVWPLPGRSWKLRPMRSQLAWLAAGTVPFALTWMAYNYLRFGNPLTTGYELEANAQTLTVSNVGEFLAGVLGLLLSPGKGLALYATPVLLGLWAAPKFWRTHRPEAVFIYGAAATTFAGVALWRDWTGGWCWGPRLLLNVIPLMIVPAAALLSSWVDRGHWQRWTIAVLGTISVGVQLLGVLPNYLTWYETVGNYYLVYFSPMYSPIIGHLLAIMAGHTDLFWDKVGLFFPGLTSFFSALRFALLLLASAAGWTLWRRARADALCHEAPGETPARNSA